MGHTMLHYSRLRPPPYQVSSSTVYHSSTDGPATKKVRYLDEVIKVQTDDFQKLAKKKVVGKAPAKYATLEEEVRSIGLFRGQPLQQYSIDYVHCTVPLVFNKKCTMRTALRKSFLKAFHAYSDDHVRRYGCHLQIEDHIVNYDTLTKITRGHILDPNNQVITPIVSTTTLTTNTGPKAKVSLKDSVVVVNLSRAALSATLPSSNVVRENLRPSCLINYFSF